MGRKSSASRMSPEAKKYLERLLREDRHTLAEMVELVRAKYPDEALSQSSLYRHKVKFDEIVARAREQQALAGILVEELGENPDDKVGAFLVQSITTITTHAALAAAGKEDVDIDTVRKLARAAKDVIQARSLDFKGRQAIEQAAEERGRKNLLAEQREKLDALGRNSDIDQATLKKVIQAAYGMGL